MTEQNEETSEERRAKARYRDAIALIIISGAAVWVVLGGFAAVEIVGRLSGSPHSLNMVFVWFGISVFILPVVIAIAVILAYFTPKLAIKRGYTHPRRLGTIAVSLWFLVAFVMSLVGAVRLA
jgi:hypothetical protein